MKTYQSIVVSITLLILILWFITDNFGGARFNAPSGLSFEDIKDDGIVVTGKEKKESLKKIHEILRNQR